MAPPNVSVEPFKEEVFTRLDDADPIPDPNANFDLDGPPKGPAPDPFQEFVDDSRRPLSKLMEDLPSLDALFKPFDLTSENPAANHFDDMYDYNRPTDYVYEDMDLRDPDIVRTLARAEAIFQQKALEAEENAARIMETAETEAKGRIAEAETEAKARAEAIMDEARQASEALAAKTQSDRAEAEERLARAKTAETEADEKLAAVKDKIAGMDTERATMEAELKTRRETLENECAAAKAEVENTKRAIWDEARVKGHEEGLASGLAQGLAEGRDKGFAERSAAFNEKVAGFLPVMEKMENLYNDLWKANGPMMVQLAIEAAEQILNKELSEARDLTVRAFEACIDYLSQAHRVTFLARPQDIAALEEARAEYRQRLGALVTVSFKPEESLGPGDLIMESVGRLDATVKRRAAQVMEVLRNAFQGGALDPSDQGKALDPPDQGKALDPSDASHPLRSEGVDSPQPSAGAEGAGNETTASESSEPEAPEAPEAPETAPN